MTKVAVVYGSSTGAAEGVAEKIQGALDGAELLNIADIKLDDLKAYDFLVLGLSTTGVGDPQDDWEVVIDDLKGLDLSGKKVAIFGLGDSASFSTSFAGGMKWIYDAVKDSADEVLGAVSTDGYTYDDSESIVDGKFVGLPLDEDNEYDMTDERIKNWVTELKKHIG